MLLIAKRGGCHSDPALAGSCMALTSPNMSTIPVDKFVCCLVMRILTPSFRKLFGNLPKF